jgi:hypothetical protein
MTSEKKNEDIESVTSSEHERGLVPEHSQGTDGIKSRETTPEHKVG